MLFVLGLVQLQFHNMKENIIAAFGNKFLLHWQGEKKFQVEKNICFYESKSFKCFLFFKDINVEYMKNTTYILSNIEEQILLKNIFLRANNGLFMKTQTHFFCIKCFQ